MNVSINIKFQNPFNKTITYSTALNFRVDSLFAFCIFEIFALQYHLIMTPPILNSFGKIQLSPPPGLPLQITH